MAKIEEIKSAIVDREDEILQKFEKENLIGREHFEEVQKAVSTDVALIITGVRRCGKSIFAFMLGKQKKYAYVNFEDERLRLSAGELNLVLEAVYSLKGEVDLFIFDEIQNIEGWERFVSRLIPTKKVIITGSNARLLSKELATFLTGRHIDFTLFPFNFREFLAFHSFTPNIHSTKDIAKTKNFLEKYLTEGGFPLRYKIGKIFLIETFQDILERDIIQRYKIKHVKMFKEMSKYLISQTAREISYNKLKNAFMVKSVHTIKNYVSYLENAYLVFVLERFSFKLKEQALAPKKVYVIDPGIINATGFAFSDNRGRIMENVVAIELLRRTFANHDQELYYWKDHQQREVDFVLKEGKKIKQLVQACYDLSNIDVREREINALLRAEAELKCKNLLIITSDYEAEEKKYSSIIKFIPLWKWLLERKRSEVGSGV